MSRFVLLDSGPLGLLSHPKNSDEISEWVEEQGPKGVLVTVPEIIDYELRRELLRAGRRRGLRRLDVLKSALYFQRLTSEAMLKAAEFWAEIRRTGRPTAGPDALDVDVILAAQGWVLQSAGHDVVVATDNPSHLARFLTAKSWRAI